MRECEYEAQKSDNRRFVDQIINQNCLIDAQRLNLIGNKFPSWVIIQTFWLDLFWFAAAFFFLVAAADAHCKLKRQLCGLFAEDELGT